MALYCDKIIIPIGVYCNKWQWPVNGHQLPKYFNDHIFVILQDCLKPGRCCPNLGGGRLDPDRRDQPADEVHRGLGRRQRRQGFKVLGRVGLVRADRWRNVDAGAQDDQQGPLGHPVLQPAGRHHLSHPA